MRESLPFGLCRCCVAGLWCAFDVGGVFPVVVGD